MFWMLPKNADHTHTMCWAYFDVDHSRDLVTVHALIGAGKEIFHTVSREEAREDWNYLVSRGWVRATDAQVKGAKMDRRTLDLLAKD